MCWDCLLDHLRTYQTVAAGFLALLGVIIAVMGNAAIARRERRAKRADDAESLRVALLAELRYLITAYVDRVASIRSAGAAPAEPNTAFVVPVDRMTDIYQSSLDKLGLLPVDVLARVLPAYLAASHLPNNVRLHEDPDRAPNVSMDFILITLGHFEVVCGLHEERLKLFADAADALERWKP